MLELISANHSFPDFILAAAFFVLVNKTMLVSTLKSSLPDGESDSHSASQHPANLQTSNQP